MSGRTVPREYGFGNLLSGPFNGGMGRDVEMNCTAPVMGQHHEHEQDPQADRLNNQENQWKLTA